VQVRLKFGLLFCSIALLGSIPAPALAEQANPANDGSRPRRDGLFTRATLGAGAATSDDESTDESLGGAAAFLFSLDAGGTLAAGLAFHGRLSFNAEPSVSSGDEPDRGSLTIALLGVGLTTYIHSNVFLTGVIGFSHTFGPEYGGLDGAGFIGDVGYEWPAGGDWGIGIAGRFEIHSVGADDAELMTESFGVLVSLTQF
jgi:hypothetical protein